MRCWLTASAAFLRANVCDVVVTSLLTHLHFPCISPHRQVRAPLAPGHAAHAVPCQVTQLGDLSDAAAGMEASKEDASATSTVLESPIHPPHPPTPCDNQMGPPLALHLNLPCWCGRSTGTHS